MPIYSYRCNNCGEVSDIFLRSRHTKVSCPNCGNENLEKLISASYIVKTNPASHGGTCCGRTERCDKPPCSSDSGCQRDKSHG